MSREEITGEKYTIAFGVDHVTGAFAQLWLNPADDQDGALVRLDSDGVHLDSESEEPLDPVIQRFVDNTITRFKQFKAMNPNDRPNIGEQDVIELARVAGGFDDIAMAVYHLFGDNA